MLVITTGALLATTAGVPPSFASGDEPKPQTAVEARAVGVAVPQGRGQKLTEAQTACASGMAAISSRTRSAAILNAGSPVTP